MTNSEKQDSKQKKNNWSKYIFIGALMFVFVYALTAGIVDSRLNEYKETLTGQIAEQETLLAAIAETIARGGADTITESIIRDCTLSERASFDDLLGRLNSSLSYSQLVELERLFGRCASFFSERKSVMSARFAREIEVYENHVIQLSAIDGNDLSEKYSVDSWHALAAEEQKQNELFTELVQLQEEIIKTLLEGSSIDSTEIVDILTRVSEVQGILAVSSQQAAAIRSELVSL